MTSPALEGKVRIEGRKPSKENPAPASVRRGAASLRISSLHHLNGNFLRPHPHLAQLFCPDFRVKGPTQHRRFCCAWMASGGPPCQGGVLPRRTSWL